MNPPPCIHCGNPAKLVKGSAVWPHRQDLAKKWVWVCDPCNARCGCHGETKKPLGYPANCETRRARIMLHNLRLDPLWRKHGYTREDVYQHLSKSMGLPRSETHVGMFTLEQCRTAWVELGDLWPSKLIEE